MKFKSEKGFAMFWVIFMCMILNVTTGINMVGDTSDDLENGTSIIDRAEMAENATEEANKLNAMSLLESQIQTTYWTYFAEGNEFSTEDIESVAGVEVDRYGAPIAYWISKFNPESHPRWNQHTMNEWKRVPAFGAKTGRRNVMQVMADVERPAQRRGVPMLAPVVEALQQLKRYSEAELMAAVVSGMFTVFIKSNTPNSPLTSMFDPAQQIDQDPKSYELGNGAIVALDENEEVQTANPGRPNTAFDGFVIAISRQIGAALEIPYELLVKNFTASYSASRAALLEAWKMFRMRREWIVGNFCQPIYEEWLAEAVLKGRIKAPGFFDDPAIKAAWCGAEWYGDSQGQLDPLKEANAAKVRVEEGFSTREREAAELTGMKYETIHAVRRREESMRRADGLSGTAPASAVKQGEKDDDD